MDATILDSEFFVQAYVFQDKIGWIASSYDPEDYFDSIDIDHGDFDLTQKYISVIMSTDDPDEENIFLIHTLQVGLNPLESSMDIADVAEVLTQWHQGSYYACQEMDFEIKE